MDDLDYRILIDLQETLNLTKVAQKYFFSQPAITKRIQNIEEELGCQLMIRWKKGVIFTPVGETVVSCCRGVVQQQEALRAAVQQTRGIVSGSLQILCSLNYARYRLPEVLKRYSDRYPAVEVAVTADKSKHIYKVLQQEKACVAIARGEHAWDGGRILLSTEPMCLVCSHENRGRPLTEYSYIGHNTDGQMMAQIQRWVKENGLSLGSARLWVDDIGSCKEMALRGIGWCILPQICLDRFDGHIRELVFADGTPFTRSTYAIFRNEYGELPQVKLFLEMLTQAQAVCPHGS